MLRCLKTVLFLGFILLPMRLLHADMKCETGKCQVGKCEVGKCGAALIATPKIPLKVPSKRETSKKSNSDTNMKCGASNTKKIPKKSVAIKEKRITKPTIKQLFNVNTVHVRRENSSPKQTNYGYIVAKDSHIIEVTSWFSGYVKKLYVDTLYTRVKRGEPLALIYSPEVYKAKQDYLNALKFHAKRPSVQMVQSAKTKLILLGVSQTEIVQVQKESKVSRYTTMYAPVSGWIFEKNINQGSYINNKISLYKIIDLSSVWMEVKLFQNQIENIASIERFTVHVKGVPKEYMAKKELLYPMLNLKEATITLRLSIENKDEMLKPGMYAKVDAKATDKSRLVIPQTAAIRKSGTWYAFLATEFKGEYEPVEIQVVPLDNKHFEVLNGLNEGEEIVNNALFMMDSDAQINSIY